MEKGVKPSLKSGIKREGGKPCFGAGIDTNIEKASIKALVSALNRSWLK